MAKSGAEWERGREASARGRQPEGAFAPSRLMGVLASPGGAREEPMKGSRAMNRRGLPPYASLLFFLEGWKLASWEQGRPHTVTDV